MIASTVRAPRGIVFVNGTRVAWVSIEVNNNNYYQADSFRVKVPVEKRQPSGINRDWWASEDSLEVEIYIGFPADVNNYDENDLDMVILGQADYFTDDPMRDIIELVGRDYSSKFIDTKTTIKWVNKTSSQIATDLAEKYGLDAVVEETSRKAGTLYEIDHTKLTNQDTEWNLLVWLARQENFQVYVKGTELHFEPKKSDLVYPLEWTPETASNLRSCRGKILFERDLTLAKDITVRVESYDYKKKKKIVAEAKMPRSRDRVLKRHRIPIAAPQAYVVRVANKSKEQCLQIAQQKLAEISRHQIKLLMHDFPADNILSARHAIRVSGTGAYDMDYYADSIIRTLNLEDGYKMEVSAKNHDTNSQAAI